MNKNFPDYCENPYRKKPALSPEASPDGSNGDLPGDQAQSNPSGESEVSMNGEDDPFLAQPDPNI
jgi:hypothetical protein